MFAVASMSEKSKNNVRAHIVKYRKGEQHHIRGQKNLIQVPTNEYRELHRLADMDLTELNQRFMSKESTHKVDIDTMTQHSLDCDKCGENYILAHFADSSKTDLNFCDDCKCVSCVVIG